MSTQARKHIKQQVDTASNNRCAVVADWLTYVKRLAPVSVDFMYVDPPFNTGITQRGRRGVNVSYQDSWPTITDYISWLRQRVSATLPAIKETGSIMLHIDHRTCHHVRLLLDELLGPDRFINHLIWSYGLGGSSPRTYARKHDDILFYSLNPKLYYFEAPRIAATSRMMAGQTKKSTDVLNIPALNNQALERTGYPTQKPLQLLTMLVCSASPKGGIVLDPCCGSGTTLVAAAKSGRIPMGCDMSADAVKIANSRLTLLAG